MEIIEWQGLWSGGIVETSYRLFPACSFIVINIIVWIVVGAVNVMCICGRFCLVGGLLLVLSLLLGSCNVAASAVCSQGRERGWTNPI